MISLKSPHGEVMMQPEDGTGDQDVIIPITGMGKVVGFDYVISSATRQTIATSVMTGITELKLDLKRRSNDSFFLFEANIKGLFNHVCSWAVWINNQPPDKISPIANTNTAKALHTNYEGYNNTSYATENYFQQIYEGPDGDTEDEFTAQVYAVSTWSTANYTTYVNDRSQNDMSTKSIFAAWEIER